MTIKEIAAILKVGAATVQAHLYRHGIQILKQAEPRSNVHEVLRQLLCVPFSVKSSRTKGAIGSRHRYHSYCLTVVISGDLSQDPYRSKRIG